MSTLHTHSLPEFELNTPKLIRSITAQYDEDGLIIYQAYKPQIAQYAVAHQAFGGPFKLGRMTWIKPNFLWMMHRAGWASKEDQERILAIKLSHEFFQLLLDRAVLSTYTERIHGSREGWKFALSNSEVRVQWDPAYNLFDQRQDYRAIQIGIKGGIARRYALEDPLSIEDITPFVRAQYQLLKDRRFDEIQLPVEQEYRVRGSVEVKLGMDGQQVEAV
ncbi:DUF4291 domain-containing protein [Pontibacter sp. G13]|uniref:DUF4291 domain-containing protein n=1 Tax=Pontibacter sp. G13 TaxID=3074898 RepID=UPI00288C1A5D|nr:DUF4291 domain-containing protein [Pontibacter sp. G13]WNJ17757.1 DUF4291 domain-containing protein [Pontibacter sp. G13]